MLTTIGLIALLLVNIYATHTICKCRSMLSSQRALLDNANSEILILKEDSHKLEINCSELLYKCVAKDKEIKDLRAEVDRYRTVELNNGYDDLRIRYNKLFDAAKALQRQIRGSVWGVNSKIVIQGPIVTDEIFTE